MVSPPELLFMCRQMTIAAPVRRAMSTSGCSAPYVLVAVRVDVVREERHDRVYYDELGIYLPDGPLQFVQVVRYYELLFAPNDARPRRVSAGGEKARDDGIGGAVFGGDYQRPAPLDRLPVGHRLARRDAGGQVIEDSALTLAGVPVEDA